MAQKNNNNQRKYRYQDITVKNRNEKFNNDPSERIIGSLNRKATQAATPEEAAVIKTKIENITDTRNWITGIVNETPNMRNGVVIKQGNPYSPFNKEDVVNMHSINKGKGKQIADAIAFGPRNQSVSGDLYKVEYHDGASSTAGQQSSAMERIKKTGQTLIYDTETLPMTNKYGLTETGILTEYASGVGTITDITSDNPTIKMTNKSVVIGINKEQYDRIMPVIEKFKNGEELSRTEKALMDRLALTNSAKIAYNKGLASFTHFPGIDDVKGYTHKEVLGGLEKLKKLGDKQLKEVVTVDGVKMPKAFAEIYKDMERTRRSGMVITTYNGLNFDSNIMAGLAQDTRLSKQARNKFKDPIGYFTKTDNNLDIFDVSRNNIKNHKEFYEKEYLQNDKDMIKEFNKQLKEKKVSYRQQEAFKIAYEIKTGKATNAAAHLAADDINTLGNMLVSPVTKDLRNSQQVVKAGKEGIKIGDTFVIENSMGIKNSRLAYGFQDGISGELAIKGTRINTKNFETKDSTFDTFHMKKRAAYHVVSVDKLNETQVGTIKKAMPGVKGERMYRVSFQAVGMKGPGGANHVHHLVGTADEITRTLGKNAAFVGVFNGTKLDTSNASNEVLNKLGHDKKGVLVPATADTIIQETERAYTDSAVRRLREYSLKTDYRLHLHAEHLRSEAIKELGPKASEKAIKKRAMEINKRLFNEVRNAPNYLDTYYAQTFGYLHDGNFDAYTTTLDSMYQLTEQAYNLRDVNNLLFEKIREANPNLKDVDFSKMTKKEIQNYQEQYATWKSAIMNGSPNESRAGVRTIKIRNGEALSKAYFSLEGWGNAGEGAELIVGTNGVDLAKKMAMADPVLKSLDDERQAAVYAKGMINHLYKTGQIDSIDWLNPDDDINKINQSFSQYVKDNIEKNPSWTRKYNKNLDIHGIQPLLGYNSLDEIENVISTIGSQTYIKPSDFKNNPKAVGDAIRNIAEQTYQIDDTQLMDEGKKVANYLKDAHINANEKLVKNSIQAALKNGRDVSIGENAVFIDGQKLSLGKLVNDVNGAIYTNINGTNYATPLSFNVIEKYDPLTREMIPDRIEYTTNYIQGTEGTSEGLLNAIFRPEKDNPTSSVLSVVKKYMGNDTIVTNHTARQAMDTIAYKVDNIADALAYIHRDNDTFQLLDDFDLLNQGTLTEDQKYGHLVALSKQASERGSHLSSDGMKLFAELKDRVLDDLLIASGVQDQDIIDLTKNARINQKGFKHGLGHFMQNSFVNFGLTGPQAAGKERQIMDGMEVKSSSLARAQQNNPGVTLAADDINTTVYQENRLKNISKESGEKLVSGIGGYKYEIDSTTLQGIVDDYLAKNQNVPKYIQNQLRGLSTYDGNSVLMPEAAEAGFDQQSQVKKINTSRLSLSEEGVNRLYKMEGLSAKIEFDQSGRIIFKYGEGAVMTPESQGILLKGYTGETIEKMANDNLATLKYFKNGREVKAQQIQDILENHKIELGLPDGSPAKPSVKKILEKYGIEEKIVLQDLSSRGTIKLNTGNGEKGASYVLQVGMGKTDARVNTFLEEAGLSHLKGTSLNFDHFENLDNNNILEGLIKSSSENKGKNSTTEEILNNALGKAGFADKTELKEAIRTERFGSANVLREAFKEAGLSSDFISITDSRAGMIKHGESGINIGNRLLTSLQRSGMHETDILNYMGQYFDGITYSNGKFYTDQAVLKDAKGLAAEATKLETGSTITLANGKEIQYEYHNHKQLRMTTDNTSHKKIRLDHIGLGKQNMKHFGENEFESLKLAMQDINGAITPELNTQNIYDSRMTHLKNTMASTFGETRVISSGQGMWNQEIEKEFLEKYNMSDIDAKKVMTNYINAGYTEATIDKIAIGHQATTNKEALAITNGYVDEAHVQGYAKKNNIQIMSLQEYSNMSEAEQKVFLSNGEQKIIDLGDHIGNLRPRAQEATGTGRYLAIGYTIPGSKDTYGNNLLSDTQKKLKSALYNANEYLNGGTKTIDDVSESIKNLGITLSNEVRDKNGFVHNQESGLIDGMIATAHEEKLITQSGEHYIDGIKVSDFTNKKIRPGIVGISEADARKLYGAELAEILGESPETDKAINNMMETMKTHGTSSLAVRYPARREGSISRAYVFVRDDLQNGQISIDRVTMAGMGGDYDTDQIASLLDQNMATITDQNGNKRRVMVSQATYREIKDNHKHLDIQMDDEHIWDKRRGDALLEGQSNSHFFDKTDDEIKEMIYKENAFTNTGIDTETKGIASAVGGLDAGLFDVKAGRDYADMLGKTQYAQENRAFSVALSAINNIPETATLTPKSAKGAGQFTYGAMSTFEELITNPTKKVLYAKSQKELEGATIELYNNVVTALSDDAMKGKVSKELIGSMFYGKEGLHVHEIASELAMGLMQIRHNPTEYDVLRNTDEMLQRHQYEMSGPGQKSSKEFSEGLVGQMREANPIDAKELGLGEDYTTSKDRFAPRGYNQQYLDDFRETLPQRALSARDNMNILNADTEAKARDSIEQGIKSEAAKANQRYIDAQQQAGNPAADRIADQMDDSQKLAADAFDHGIKGNPIVSKIEKSGSLGKILLGAAIGVTLSGYNSNIVKRMPAPATDQGQDARTAEKGYSISQIPQMSDTSLPAMQGAPKKGYIININANSPSGQEFSRNIIPTAINNSIGNKNTSINMTYRREDNRMTDSQLTNMMNRTLSY